MSPYPGIGILPNVWLGVTIENQQNIGRVKHLLKTPAAVRFVSVEPMLGPVDFGDQIKRLDWVICGAEQGPSARFMDRNWANILQIDCDLSCTPFFFKKNSCGEGALFGKERHEFPNANEGAVTDGIGTNHAGDTE